jgi:uncharacterized OB-fold protein
VMRALMPSGLADIWGATRVPLYVLNVTYPRLNSEIIRFCSGTLREAGIPARLLGKRVLPMAGEYNVGVAEEGVRGFMSPAGLAGELTGPAEENARAVTAARRTQPHDRRADRGRGGGAFRVAAVCADCGFTLYPPRDACPQCLSPRVAFRDVPAGGVLLAETTIRASTDVYCRERTPWRIGTVVLDLRAIVRHGLTVAREAKPRVCRPRKPYERNCAAAMSTAKHVRGTARHGVVPVCPPVETVFRDAGVRDRGCSTCRYRRRL